VLSHFQSDIQTVVLKANDSNQFMEESLGYLRILKTNIDNMAETTDKHVGLEWTNILKGPSAVSLDASLSETAPGPKT
jgi:hypothetical protein